MGEFLKKRKGGLLIVIVAMLLSACSDSSSPKIEIYKVLEKIVVMEKQFSKQQQPLRELEKEEKEIYDQIISLGIKERERIQELADKALKLIDEREKRIHEEKSSMEDSKAQFQKAEKLAELLQDEVLKKEADRVISLMKKRYASYDNLNNHYQAAIQLDRQLYRMFKNEEITLKELEGQIRQINKAYKKVIDANETFNDSTQAYNSAKLDFYRKAGLKVMEEEGGI